MRIREIAKLECVTDTERSWCYCVERAGKWENRGCSDCTGKQDGALNRGRSDGVEPRSIPGSEFGRPRPIKSGVWISWQTSSRMDDDCEC
jgi:hypothetical protein